MLFRSVAEAFDVDLDIRFAKFSDLLPRLGSMTPLSFEVPSFEDELASGALDAKHTRSALQMGGFNGLQETVASKASETIDVHSVFEFVVRLIQHSVTSPNLKEAALGSHTQGRAYEVSTNLQAMAGGVTPPKDPSAQAIKIHLRAA